MDNDYLAYLYATLGYILDDVEQQAIDQYEEPTVQSITQSLDALGYDVVSQAARVDSLINVLLANNEWDVDAAVRMMAALEDGYISELELDTVLGVGAVAKLEDVILDDEEEEVTKTLDETVSTIKQASEEEWWTWSPIDWLADTVVLEPLEAILVSVSRNLGERLEAFIANALGIEREG